MGINKNINIDASDCKTCEQIATVTISPTLLTDREATYGIQTHSLPTCECDHDSVENIIEEAVEVANAYTDEQISKNIVSVEDVTDEDIENLFE